jgi:hypothetical protein
MPFVRDGKELLFVQYIEPHRVVQCPVSTQSVGYVDAAPCRVVVETSWPAMTKLLNVQELRLSTAAVDRGPDYIAMGHAKEGRDYTFFFYTFLKEPPYSVTGASSRFRVFKTPGTQYVSGLVAVEDWYVVSYSVSDRSTQHLWFRKCEVDAMVRTLTAPFARPMHQYKTLFIAALAALVITAAIFYCYKRKQSGR